MKDKRFNVEDLIYLAILFFASWLRLIGLGILSLSGYEAQHALQALSVAQGAPQLTGSQPLYLNGTALLFFVFGSNEFLARIIPAVCGLLMVIPVYLLRQKIGRLPAMMAAFLLAMDPVLVASSRQADSLIIAILFLSLSFVFLINKKAKSFGISLGLLFLAGTQLWLGLISLAAAIIFARFFLVEDKADDKNLDEDTSEFFESCLVFLRQSYRSILTGLLATAILGGAAFMLIPGGLNGVFASPVYFIQNITNPATNASSILDSLIAVISYEPLLLVLGVTGIIWAMTRRNKLDLFLSFWWAAAFIFYLIYPARVVNDLAWNVIPLWILSARFFGWILFSIDPDEKKWFAGFVVLSLVIFVFITLSMVYLILFFNTQVAVADQNEALKRVIVVVGGVLLMLAMTYLVGFGWSARLAMSQLMVSLCIFLLAITFSGAWNAAGLTKNPEMEMLRYGSDANAQQLMDKTMQDVSRWKLGAGKLLDVVVINKDFDDLRWTLRDYRDARFVNSIPSSALPSIIISPVDYVPSSEQAYRGTAFALHQKPAWTLMFSQEWVNWIFFRKAPLDRDIAILWVRNDLFPGGNAMPQTIPTE
ncbi:MAG: glycosyltransferase family 39 protein [Anaerolineae bacterium]|nr:glycosyltransferase family 39 protein [Anaerolineae bacterium]